MTATPTERESVSGTLNRLRTAKKTAFIPFITAGDPDMDTTAEALRRLDANGASVIELGVPYSDPLADGPVIQEASARALNAGATLDRVLSMLKGVSPEISAPVVLFTYYNPIMARGPDRFCEQARASGVSGLLVPDLPLEETDIIRDAAGKAGLELVLLTTPTTPVDRAARIAAASQGFVYLVSVAGVTGTRATMDDRVEGLIKTLKQSTDKVVCVGFGVSTPEQAKQLVEWGADGVIVGSALVRALGEAPSAGEGLDALSELSARLSAAL